MVGDLSVMRLTVLRPSIGLNTYRDQERSTALDLEIPF